MIIDIPEDLPLLMVAFLASSVPEWNRLPDRFVKTVFEIASGLVHDNGMLLLFHLDDHQMMVNI